MNDVEVALHHRQMQRSHTPIGGGIDVHLALQQVRNHLILVVFHSCMQTCSTFQRQLIHIHTQIAETIHGETMSVLGGNVECHIAGIH